MEADRLACPQTPTVRTRRKHCFQVDNPVRETLVRALLLGYIQ